MMFVVIVESMGKVKVICSDDCTTFQAAAKTPPKLLHTTEFRNAFCKIGVLWQFIPPYAPSQGGAWESMVKQFKLILQRILDSSKHIPNLMELITFCSNSVRVVNEQPLTVVSGDHRDNTVLTPTSLLTTGLDPYTPVGRAHDKDKQLRSDYRFNLALADRFWHDWIDFYLPTLQGKNKWRETVGNLKIKQLVLVGDTEDLLTKGNTAWAELLRSSHKCTTENPLLERLRLQSLILTLVKALMSLTIYSKTFQKLLQLGL